MARILLVEDEPELARALRQGLEDELHVVEHRDEGTEGLFAAISGDHDLLILDWMLPGFSGVDICRRVRLDGLGVPILLLTARDTPRDVVAGLSAGADDYLRKPFDFEELIARVQALLRRAVGVRGPCYVVGALELDPAAHAVRWQGRAVHLAAKEFQVLEALVRRRGRVLSKGQLTQAVWGEDAEPDSNAVEVYVASLRRKLSPALIRTVRGVGYTLQEPG